MIGVVQTIQLIIMILFVSWLGLVFHQSRIKLEEAIKSRKEKAKEIAERKKELDRLMSELAEIQEVFNYEIQKIGRGCLDCNYDVDRISDIPLDSFDGVDSVHKCSG